MIKVENVSKSYELDDGNSVVGLKNVSFEVKKGDKIRFVYLPTNTTAQSTFTIDTDIVLEKTE